MVERIERVAESGKEFHWHMMSGINRLETEALA